MSSTKQSPYGHHTDSRGSTQLISILGIHDTQISGKLSEIK
jgi:hypothetical protein